MNNKLLRETRRNLHAWVTRSKNETVHLDKRMEVLMLALADICEALTTHPEQDLEELKVIDEKERS